MELEVIHTQRIKLNLKPEAFTDKFIEEFQQTHYPFESIYDHAEHLSQCFSRGILDVTFFSTQELDGYGKVSEFITSAKVETVDLFWSEEQSNDR